jgi:hypothetical protein
VTPTLETYLRSQYPDDAEAEAEQRVDGARGAADEK